ncbi:MAG: hypothetical protein VX278_01635 [Myxococcota bacterium]|nr:hypothetical protein [Myxococcota bacterium]
MFFLLFGFADAHESLPQDVIVADQIPLFSDLRLDSGWISAGVLGVRIEILANGGADVDMKGEGILEWPSDLELSLVGEPENGYIALDTTLDAVVSIRFDVSGYAWEAPIANRSTAFLDELTFDPFALGQTLFLEAQTAGDTLIDYSTTVLGIVDVNFYGNIQPNCSLQFRGSHWSVEEQMIVQEDEKASFLPTLGADSFDTEAIYNAELEASLNLDFVPTFEVCLDLFVTTPCYAWDATSIPLSSEDDLFMHAFPASPLSFPLPSLLANAEAIDFGVLYPGQLANAELTLANIGLLDLEGSASIRGGEGQFSVFPSEILSRPAGSDGTMISFLGAAEGVFEAELEITSNDPAQPTKIIPLTATVIPEPIEETSPDGEEVEGTKESQMVEGCGCSTRSMLPHPFFLLVPLLVLARRKN